MKSKTIIHLKVKVITGARAFGIVENEKGHLEISVREPAERGEANKKVVETLCNKFKGKKVTLIKGHHSPNKIFAIE